MSVFRRRRKRVQRPGAQAADRPAAHCPFNRNALHPGMFQTSEIAGVILAGGGGRRMFPHSDRGGDKALVPLKGQPLIAHIAATIAPQVSRLLVNANGDAERLAFLELPIIPDAVPDQGPLAGLLAVMDWLHAHNSPAKALLSVSTDTPFLPEDLAQRLAAEAGRRPAIAASQGRLHAVVGLWPMSLRDALAQNLANGQRGVEKFALRHEAIAVSFGLRTIGGRTVDPFFNANTPQDLAEAEAVLLEI